MESYAREKKFRFCNCGLFSCEDIILCNYLQKHAVYSDGSIKRIDFKYLFDILVFSFVKLIGLSFYTRYEKIKPSNLVVDQKHLLRPNYCEVYEKAKWVRWSTQH
jgi:hypothetical protein